MADKTVPDNLAYAVCAKADTNPSCPGVCARFDTNTVDQATQLQTALEGLACDTPPPTPTKRGKLTAAHKATLTKAGVDAATQARMEKCTAIDWTNIIALFAVVQKDGPAVVASLVTAVNDVLAAFGL